MGLVLEYPAGATPLDPDEAAALIFRDIAGVEVEDGIIFDPASVEAEEIRKDAGYGGARVLISAGLDFARCKTQIDIGFGDAVTPGPVAAEYPTLIDDMPAPKLRTFPSIRLFRKSCTRSRYLA